MHRLLCRSFVLMILTLWLCGLQSSIATAQTFPSGPVTLVVPFAAGGPNDTIARALAKDLAVVWRQPVIVENAAGAGGVIGASRVARAVPDGRTLLVTIGDVMVHNRFIFKSLPYDPDKNFVPVIQVLRSPNLVLANYSLPANSMGEFIELARRTPGGLAYSSSGIGSGTYFLFETLAKRHGVELVHVPYKGQGPAMQGLAAGEVAVSSGGEASIAGMIGGSSGARIKVLAIGGKTRSKTFPNVPTLSQSGPGFDSLNETNWTGVFAPAGTGATVVDRINKDIASVVTPDFVARYVSNVGSEAVLNSSAEFSAVIRADVDQMAHMARSANLKPQE